MKSIYFNSILILCMAFMIMSCEEEEYAIPQVPSGLQNDCIKHSLGPNVVGLNMEFAYAMAIKPEEGKLTSATVEASIEGADGTFLSNKSYHTDGSGQDIGIEVGDSSRTNGNTTVVNFNRDTSAATLRYYYTIPEEARGKSVTFTFSATSSNNETISQVMGPYDIAEMDFELDLIAQDSGTAYISISDMQVYTFEEAQANPDKIDLIYLYRSLDDISFGHALVSPSADSKYLPDVLVPAGVNNHTRMVKAWNIRDRHLARLQYGEYVDDRDLLEIDFEEAPDYAINMREEAGLWVETADNSYKAFIFINSTDSGSKEMTLSIKRIKVN